MSHCILWIDMSLAKKFVFTKNGYEMERIAHKPKSERHDQHSDRIDQIKIEELKAFFKAVSANLKDMNEILIAGPGLAKKIFRKYLVEHDPSLAAKIIGEIVMDHPSDARIIKSAKEYLKSVHIPI